MKHITADVCLKFRKQKKSYNKLLCGDVHLPLLVLLHFPERTSVLEGVLGRCIHKYRKSKN